MSDPLLLSYRQAARLLGVGRNDKLHRLIAKGLLKPVSLLGRSYIPRAQLERLAETGDGPAASPPRARAKRSSGASTIAEVVI